MFQFNSFTAAAVDRLIAAAAREPVLKPRFLTINGPFPHDRLRGGYVYDLSVSRIGSGVAAFQAARAAMLQWIPFDLGWTRVRNPHQSIALEKLVAVEVQSLKLWALNISRITDCIDTPTRFGFVYATTSFHVEDGEERFHLELDAKNGDVLYTLEAVSQPRALLARAGYPITRRFQKRFARDSHGRMRRAVDAN